MIRNIRGNARGCLVFEPMFILPYNMYLTYASVYMLKLGLNETQIGMITSIGLIVQMIAAFLSGPITDRMGRRYALLVFDLLGWGLATGIWAISQNFWFFLAAGIVNGLQRIPTTAWYCLLVEDTEPKYRSKIFTILQFISVLGGLAAPLGGIIVNHMSLIPGVRLMYGIACMSMIVMFFGRHLATHETEIGIRKKKEARSISYRGMLQEYQSVLRTVWKNTPIMMIFAVYILFNFQITLKNTYLSIYLVDHLKIKDSWIAGFPAVSSLAILVMLLGVVPKLNEQHARRYMVCGFSLTAIANGVLLFTKPGNLTMVVLSTIFTAIGTILSTPYLEATVANEIDDDTRANSLSILGVCILIFTFPAGILGGWTYTIDPRIPFCMILATCVGSIVCIVVYSKKLVHKVVDNTHSVSL